MKAVDVDTPSALCYTAPMEQHMQRRPIVIAHRGANREAPENTLPALQRALDLGAQGIEFDVLLTKDKVPVLGHNDDLSKLSPLNGYAHATPFAALRSLDVGSHFGAASAGITMPTLAEALELIRFHDVTTIVEIKAQPRMTVSAAELIGGITSDFRMRGPLVISTSSPGIIRELKRRHPQIPRALILKRRAFSFFGATLFARLRKLSGIHVSLGALSPSLVKRVHQRGGQVCAWTVNTPDEIDRCIAYEVDGLITDDVAQTANRLTEMFGAAGG